MRAEQYTWGARKPSVGGAADSDASPFGPWGAHAATSEPEDLASIQKRTEYHTQRVKDAERRILHKVEETRQIGASTLSQLHTQREQLGRVATAQEEVQANLATSDRLLRGMESWRGAFVNTVTGWFGADDTPAATGSSAAAQGGEAHRPAAGSVAGAGARSSAAPAAQLPAPGELDGVGQISAVVSDLRLQADQLNAELRGQARMLDDVSDAAERNAADMQRTAHRTRALR